MTRSRSKRVHAKVGSSPTAWINQTKYRALAWVAAIVLATVTTITVIGAPWVPVVGVAVAAAAMSMAKITSRLVQPTCLECGHDLSKEPVSVQGIACPSCGSVNSPGLVQLARMGDPQRHPDEQDDGERNG